MGIHGLAIIVFIFSATLVITALFRYLKLSVILGYLLVGALAGPHALGIISNSPQVNELAEFGIVFLMFTVGLEFSLSKLIKLKYPVFVIGGLQVLLTLAITTLLCLCVGVNLLPAIVIGAVTSMSSTAVVVKQLNDQSELQLPHGLNALAILLFQDLAVIPLIILIASMGSPSYHHLSSTLLQALAKGIVAILLIFVMGRLLLKPLLRIIANTRAIELFTLAVLLVTLVSAWITNLLGLSYALGAFLAGMMLAETEFRHQIEVEIRPFRDILLGLFFITIGMLTDVTPWYHTWLWVLLLLLVLIIGKMSLIALLCRLSKNNIATSIRTGLVLGQGGEFGFALLTLALDKNVIPADYAQIVLAALIISIAIAPLIIRNNKKITSWLTRKDDKDHLFVEKKIILASKKLKNHVIICGYGRVGQHLARLLEKVEVPYLALDLDAELIKRAKDAGQSVEFGDSTHPGILLSAKIDNARVLVISFSDIKATFKILAMVKHSYPELPVIVRCKDLNELKQLKQLGANRVTAEIFETSLTVSNHLLDMLDIPSSKISAIFQEVRSQDYNLLNKIFVSSFDERPSLDSDTSSQLRSLQIAESAFAVNKTLKQLNLTELGVEVVAVKRGDFKQIKPKLSTKLQAADKIILYGNYHQIENAELRLFKGE